MRGPLGFAVLVLSIGAAHQTPSQQTDAAQLALVAPWPMFGHDARHTGRTFFFGPQSAHVVWRRATGFSSFPVGVPSVTAVAADGTIYVAVLKERLLAVNPNGTFKWAYQAGGFISSSSPAIGADGAVYIGSSNGTLYAINPDGRCGAGLRITSRCGYQRPQAVMSIHQKNEGDISIELRVGTFLRSVDTMLICY
jgi:hypothetical protein